jgi:hypothetical protein
MAVIFKNTASEKCCPYQKFQISTAISMKFGTMIEYINFNILTIFKMFTAILKLFIGFAEYR